MTINPEVSCHDCFGACCQGPMTMQLTLAEKDQLERVGTKFQTILDPVDYDRDDARYPISFSINTERKTIQWIYEKTRPTEPLPANYGRYMMVGACGWLFRQGKRARRCGTYETRPQVCRDFEMGSENCITMREVKVDLLARRH
jgi:Fe-S-cluster containining protein